VLRSRSCRSALMFGDVLQHKECEELLRWVASSAIYLPQYLCFIQTAYSNCATALIDCSYIQKSLLILSYEIVHLHCEPYQGINLECFLWAKLHSWAATHLFCLDWAVPFGLNSTSVGGDCYTWPFKQNPVPHTAWKSSGNIYKGSLCLVSLFSFKFEMKKGEAESH